MAWLDRDATDRTLLAAMSRGDGEAAALLFDAHAPALFGVLRLIAARPADAERALVRGLAEAARRGAAAVPAGETVAAWLAGIAAEEAALEWSPPRRARSGAEPVEAPADEELVSGLRSGTLLVLVRGVERRRRQALALRAMLGLPPKRCGALMGVPAEEVDSLAAGGLAELRGLLRRRRPGAAVPGVPTEPAGTAFHMVPLLGPSEGGVMVARGASAQVRQAPSNGFAHVARIALRRIAARVGLLRAPHSPEARHVPGPEVRLPDPGLTPSLEPRFVPAPQAPPPAPRPTPSMSQRRFQRSTPSTERLHNPRRPLP